MENSCKVKLGRADPRLRGAGRKRNLEIDYTSVSTKTRVRLRRICRPWRFRSVSVTGLNWGSRRVCRADGDEDGFRREAEAALRLDGLTPHSDKKLPEKVRLRLAQDLGRKP
jgi:hypothetical protein